MIRRQTTVSASIVGIAALGGTMVLCPEQTVARPPADDSGAAFVLTGVVRDFRPQPLLHIDFDSPNLNGPYCKYVLTTLDDEGKPKFSANTGRRIQQEFRDAENRKICWCLYESNPQPGDNPGTYGNSSNGAVQSVSSFSQWFRDVPGVNLSTVWDMPMTLETSGTYAGSYSYETNDFFPFYPIDGELFGNGPDEHNFYFTFEVVATFTYDADAGQFLKFKGDDDTWLFIDGKMTMDHGGITGSRENHVDFNRLGLTDGETYDLRFFHAERKQPQSQFHLWTNVMLQEGSTPSISSAFD
jgi:fibro-slime domain-containing protein